MSLILARHPLLLHKARASADPLTRAANAAELHVQRWWRATWQAFQAALPEFWALSSLETVLRHAWQTYALPRFEDLHTILHRLAQGVTSSTLPALPMDVLGITQAVQAIETSLAQVPATMARVPQTLLPAVGVLTIPQQGVLARMAEGMAQETTLTPAHVERTLRTQAQEQLAMRTKRLAEELTWQSVQAGKQAGWATQEAAGELAVGVRRYWVLGARPCKYCATIPGLNPDGVGISERFDTPYGPVLSPGVHPLCKCDTDLR